MSENETHEISTLLFSLKLDYSTMDIDYEFVLSQTDDETMTQFILCDYSS